MLAFNILFDAPGGVWLLKDLGNKNEKRKFFKTLDSFLPPVLECG